MYRRQCFIGVRPVGIGLILIIEGGKCFCWRNGVCLFSRWFGGGVWYLLDLRGWVCVHRIGRAAKVDRLQ